MTQRLSDTQQGFALALTSAVLWGVSGACAQYVFQNKGLTIGWLVTVRLLLAGSLLLGYAHWRGQDVWRIWQTQRSAVSLLIFGLLGMLAIQYTYFAAIQYSNAATGTVLQYVGPVLIAVYFACVRRRWPTRAESLAVMLAFLGTVLLVTHDLGVVAGVADRVAVMYGGRVVELGSVRSILKAPQHPYTEALLRSMPRVKQTGARLASIPGQVPSPANYPKGCHFADRCPHVMDKCRAAKPQLFEAEPNHQSKCYLVEPK